MDRKRKLLFFSTSSIVNTASPPGIAMLPPANMSATADNTILSQVNLISPTINATPRNIATLLNCLM